MTDRSLVGILEGLIQKVFKEGWRVGAWDHGDHDCRMFTPTAERAWDDYKSTALADLAALPQIQGQKWQPDDERLHERLVVLLDDELAELARDKEVGRGDWIAETEANIAALKRAMALWPNCPESTADRKKEHGEDTRVDEQTVMPSERATAALNETKETTVSPNRGNNDDDLAWFAARFRRIYDGFLLESMNGVVCSIPDKGLNTPPHRTWCANCQRRYIEFKGLVEMLEQRAAADPVVLREGLDDLRSWMEHKASCWLNYKTRNLVPNPPYPPRFRRDGDPEPSCDCGLDAALAALRIVVRPAHED